MAITTFASGITKGTAVTALHDGTVVVGSSSGELIRLDAAGAVIETTDVGASVLALAPQPAAQGVFAAVRGQGVADVRFGATPSITQVTKLANIRGVAVDAATGTLLATNSRTGRLVRVHLDGTKTQVAGGLDSPGALITRAGAGAAYVLTGVQPRTLVQVEISGGTTNQLFGDLGRARGLAWTDVAGTQVAVAVTTGSVVLIDVADAAAAPVTLADGLARVWAVSRATTPGQLIVGAGDELLLVDLPPAPQVILEMPQNPMYLSSWAMVGIASTTVDPGDLVFRIEPPIGGTVSHSRDATFSQRPGVLLAASAIPGEYKLVAHHAVTGDELAAGVFTVTDVWDKVDGPPLSVIGSFGADVPDPAWGGGDPYVPQNLSVTPALGNKNVAVVIAETSDSTALSAADQAALRNEWQNEVFDGVLRGVVFESARHYWNDVSDGRLDLTNAGIVGPIRLPNAWASYASDVNTTTGQTDGWEAFGRAVVADIRTQNEAAAAAGRPPVVDLMTVDSIALVLRSLPASGMNPGRFIWPSATRPGSYQLTFEVGRQVITVPHPFGSFEVTLPILRTIQMFSMPDDWVTRETSARVRGETVAHELGHNFGLPDEYARSKHPKWATDRDLDDGQGAGTTWSLMSWEQNFAQPTVVEKMMLGWVDAGSVRNLSFATLGPVDEEIVLHASDLGAPPAGRHSVAEVRIADGRNYYFEYRRERPADPNDQDLPADRTVVGVDCVSGIEPKDRRNILRIRDDSDADKGEFQVGDDYEEKDTSSEEYPNDFLMEVLETQADSARIHITYGDAKPDPQIRPWAPSTNWKSPDLRVTNARNAADSRFRDIPWEGHENRIVATVRNPGQINATAVRVDFFVKDFTLGGGAEMPLGSDIHDVPSGSDIEFTSGVWIPPALSAIPLLNIRPHYCVVARIAAYVDPVNPAMREITLDNNEAQSNHTQVISVSASPSTREIGFVKVTNPLSEPANCRVQVRQTSPFARTYVDHAWVRLAPGEERQIRFLTESIVGDPNFGKLVDENRELIYRRPNSVRLTGIAHESRTCDGFVTGGAQVLVRAARGTRFTKFEVVGELAQGRIETVDDGSGVDGIVLVTLFPRDRPDQQTVHQGEVQNGFFEFVLRAAAEPGSEVSAHYTGSFDRAPCDERGIAQ